MSGVMLQALCILTERPKPFRSL